MTWSGERRWSILAIALVLLAFAVRVYRLDADSLWFDEATTARNLALPFGQVIAEAQSLGHGPYYLLLRLLPNLERSEFSLRYPSVLWGVLGVAAIFAVGRRLFGGGAGALASLLLLLSPMHVWYSREARTYCWVLAATLLTVGAFLDLWRQAAWGRLIAAQSVSLYAHLFAGLANVWQTIFVMALGLRSRLPWRLRRWLLAQLAVLLATGPVLGLALWSAGRKSQISWVTPPTLLTLGDLSMHLSGIKFLGQYKWSWVVWVIWMILLVWGAVTLRSSLFTAGEMRLLLLGWAGVPVAVLFLASWLFKPLYVHRYVFFTLPAYLLLISGGVARARRNGLVWLSAAVLIGGQALATLDPSSVAYVRPDWRTAQRHLVTCVEEGDLVLFHPWLLRRPFDYYNERGETVRGKLTTVGLPEGAEVVAEPVLVAEMERVENLIQAEQDRLWVVEQESDVRASDWLAARLGWKQASEQTFGGGLEVRLYVFEGGE